MSSEFCNHYGQRILRYRIRIPLKTSEPLNTRYVPPLYSGTTSYSPAPTFRFHIYSRTLRILALNDFNFDSISRFYIHFLNTQSWLNVQVHIILHLALIKTYHFRVNSRPSRVAQAKLQL